MGNLLGSALGALGPSLVTGGLSALGGYFQGQSSQASAKDQMKFQERMSNTSFQRGMTDLRKAGLNPILAAKIGGASTPQGAGYQVPNIGEAFASGAHSAGSLRQMFAGTEKTKEETKNVPKAGDLLSQQMRTAQAQAAALNAQARNYNFNSAKSQQETINLEKTNEIMDQAVASSKLEAEIDNTTFGKVMRYINRVINPFASSAKGIASLRNPVHRRK